MVTMMVPTVIVTSDAALADRLRVLQNSIGAVPSPFDCYLVLRGLARVPVVPLRDPYLAESLSYHSG